MKAPDKIYINNYNGGDILVNQWHIKPTDNPDIISHAYIRKDALLEWAEKGRKLTYGFLWDDLIDKLNSM